jgi:hypothetical protein
MAYTEPQGRKVIYDRGGVLSTINALLKDDWVLNDIQQVVNTSTYLLSQITNKKTTHGRQFMFPVQFGTSQGVGARGENIILPDPGFGEYEQAVGQVKYLYSTMYITGQAIAATQGNRAAFADALKTALRDARDGYMQDLQRQVWGDGTGAIAKVAANSTTSATLAVTDPYGLTYVQADLDNTEKVKLFRRNMNIFIAGNNLYARVIAVNANGTITLNAPISATAGNVIYRGDATGRTNVNNEITGISGLLQATGTYLGLPRAGFPEWQANLMQMGTGTGAGVTESAMRIALDTSLQNGTAPPDIIITSYKVRRRYEALLQSQRRFVNPMQLTGGFTALEFDGYPLVVDKDVPPQRMYFLRLADIHWMVMADLDWMDRDGNILTRELNKDAYKATLFTYRDLITTRPANQSVIFDLINAPIT